MSDNNKKTKEASTNKSKHSSLSSGRPQNSHSNKDKSSINRNSNRGPPGVLLSCDTGQECNCRREEIDILEYYCRNNGHEQINKRQKQQSETLVGKHSFPWRHY